MKNYMLLFTGLSLLLMLHFLPLHFPMWGTLVYFFEYFWIYVICFFTERKPSFFLLFLFGFLNDLVSLDPWGIHTIIFLLSAQYAVWLRRKGSVISPFFRCVVHGVPVLVGVIGIHSILYFVETGASFGLYTVSLIFFYGFLSLVLILAMIFYAVSIRKGRFFDF